MLKFHYRKLLVSVLLATTLNAWAAPLLIRSSVPGFMMQEVALYKTCTLDDNGSLVINNRLNGLSSKNTTKLQVSVKSIKDSISSAFMGKLQRPESIADKDKPTSAYYAYQKQRNGKLAKVLLWQDNGVPLENIYNDSSAALTLRKFMDTICGS
jgi:hypothetical protein